MRYHYEKPHIYLSMYGTTYVCDHPVDNRCTLFQIEGKELAVIRQSYKKDTKETWWSELDPWLTNELYLNPGFKQFFDERSGPAANGLYPTVTVRQIILALKIKPIRKERWETCFYRRNI